MNDSALALLLISLIAAGLYIFAMALAFMWDKIDNAANEDVEDWDDDHLAH